MALEGQQGKLPRPTFPRQLQTLLEETDTVQIDTVLVSLLYLY